MLRSDDQGFKAVLWADCSDCPQCLLIQVLELDRDVLPFWTVGFSCCRSPGEKCLIDKNHPFLGNHCINHLLTGQHELGLHLSFIQFLLALLLGCNDLLADDLLFEDFADLVAGVGEKFVRGGQLCSPFVKCFVSVLFEACWFGDDVGDGLEVELRSNRGDGWDTGLT